MDLHLTPHTPLKICGNMSVPVKNALRDIEKDWYKVFGYPLLVLTEITGSHTGFQMVLDCENSLLPAGLRPSLSEEYCVCVYNNQMVLTGADMRGVIYSLYQFSRVLLSVDPLWYFNDVLPSRKEKIRVSPGFRLCSHPGFRFRGWFINDEDVLNGFFPNRTDNGVMAPEGFEHIMEALLRLGGNMLVPGSFAMPDEAVRKQMADRGILSNDHHVTPLGLNMYRWPEDIPFSYSHNKELLKEYWRVCIDTLKDYEQVWTVSFRGKNDHPYWQEDPYAPETDEGRAKEIEEAILTQIELIRKVDPKAQIAFNMYNEQADFYRRGLLSIPDDIIRVWPGGGVFDESEPVRTQKGDGIYFHLTGAASNRYTEWRSPEVIFDTLSKMWNVGANSFCLFNVSNLRHLALSCNAGMDYLWDAELYAPDPKKHADGWLSSYLRAHYGDIAPQIREIYRLYYRLPIFYPLPDELAFDCKTDFGYQTPLFRKDVNFSMDLKQNAVIQGLCRFLLNPPEEPVLSNLLEDASHSLRAYQCCEEGLSEVLAKAEALTPKIPVEMSCLYLTQVLTQLRVLCHSNRALIHLCNALLTSDTLSCCKQALEEEEAVISALHLAEYGKWSTWYETERFSCIYYSRDMVANTVLRAEGKELLPVRYVGGYRNWLYFWDRLYAYQHKNSFPLLGH